MKNKILIVSILGIVLIVGYWLLSPFWRNLKLDESLPDTITDNVIEDNLMVMDENKKKDFEMQTLEMKDKIMETDDSMPSGGPQILSRSQMVARSHGVEGTALIVRSGDANFIRFEDLKTVNGPDLRIYLSSGLNAEDIVDLGPIRATEGNVNYIIPQGTDLDKYKNVMIWCRAFGVLFSYAQF